jgi:metallo-beta-lactamase class B
MKTALGILAAALAIGGPQTSTPLRPDQPVACASCEAWNRPHEPFRVFGNTYYVGTAGLSSVLITSDDGLILLDAALPQSAAAIDTSIRALGFRTRDIRLILSSHAHFDHAGGIAAIQRASGAVVAAGPAGVRALEMGEPGPDDPQYGFGRQANAFPAVPQVRAVADREILRVGSLSVTAHLTPGHTPGSAAWTWQSCEGARCLNVVYADSLNPVSAPEFRFAGERGRVDAFRRSIARVASLPCDILLSVHPDFSNLSRKLQQRARGVTPDPFIDPRGCRAYAGAATESLNRRLKEEAARPSKR